VRWGLRALALPLLAALAALVAPSGATAADGVVYEEAFPGPQYTPAPFARAPRLRFAGLRRNRRNGMAIVFVHVTAPGKVFLWGRGVRRVRRGARRPTRVRLAVRPKIPLKRFLKRHGKAPIRVNVGFQPFAGVPREFERRILLKRKRARRYR
jgi:hypothetical protein